MIKNDPWTILSNKLKQIEFSSEDSYDLVEPNDLDIVSNPEATEALLLSDDQEKKLTDDLLTTDKQETTSNSETTEVLLVPDDQEKKLTDELLINDKQEITSNSETTEVLLVSDDQEKKLTDELLINDKQEITSNLEPVNLSVNSNLEVLTHQPIVPQLIRADWIADPTTESIITQEIIATCELDSKEEILETSKEDLTKPIKKTYNSSQKILFFASIITVGGILGYEVIQTLKK